MIIFIVIINCVVILNDEKSGFPSVLSLADHESADYYYYLK